MAGSVRSRRVVSWVLIGAAVVFSVARAVLAFGEDPTQGEGWIGAPIEIVGVGLPLLLIGLGLRSERASTARATAIGAGVLAVLVGFVLVMQLLDENETTADRLLQAAGLVLYLAAVVVEVPLVRSARRRAGRAPAAR